MQTVLFVDDVSATLSFYRRAIGLRGGELDASGMYGEIDTLCFVSHLAASQAVPTGYLAASTGARTLGVMLRFVVDDLESTYERVLTGGGQKVAAPARASDGVSVAFVRDCNGILVELRAPK